MRAGWGGLLVAAALAGLLWVPTGGHGGAAPDGHGPYPGGAQETPAYDGGFHFLRVQFGAGGSGLRGFGRRGRGEAPWEHDRPRAERNFLEILSATTYVNRGEGRNDWLHLPLDDAELFRYPIAYLVEVGYWNPSDTEVRALREYLLKGGFLIVDDFRGRDLFNFQDQMRRVLPEARLFQLTGERPILPEIRMFPGTANHAIFDSFFHIADPEALIPPYGRDAPFYLGIFEDDDPSKRLLAIANFNNDIAEYWEYSERGWYPIDLANDAYKFGVNYVVYGMTH